MLSSFARINALMQARASAVAADVVIGIHLAKDPITLLHESQTTMPKPVREDSPIKINFIKTGSGRNPSSSSAIICFYAYVMHLGKFILQQVQHSSSLNLIVFNGWFTQSSSISSAPNQPQYHSQQIHIHPILPCEQYSQEINKKNNLLPGACISSILHHSPISQATVCNSIKHESCLHHQTYNLDSKLI